MTTAKIAMVTGAGPASAGRRPSPCLREGYSVVLAGRRADALEQTAAEAGPAGSRALAVPTDVSDPASVRSLFDQTKTAFGRLDLLFNNAGVGAPPVPLEDLTFEQWRQVIDVNLTGAFLCTQGAFRMMKEQTPRGGRIINNGSHLRPRPAAELRPLHGHQARHHRPDQLGRPRRPQVRHRRGQIDIGNAATEMTARMKDGVLQANGETAAEPTMDVECVARAVLYMASLPLDANVLFLTVMATQMPFVGRG